MTKKLELHEKQWEVFSDPSRFIVLVAGRRFGKTILAIIDLIASAWNNPKSRSWYISPSYRQSEMIAWKMLIDVLPKEAIVKKDETRLEIILPNGAEIALKGADNEDSLRGAGLHFVVLDEFAQIKPNVWPEIIRPMLTDTKGRALFIGTPKGKNSLWELYLKGQKKEDGFSSYCFKTVDNPYIDPSEVADAKKQMNDRYFRQEYEASFEDYTGLIWSEFNRSHIIEPIYIPSQFKKIGAIDPATTGTSASLKAAIDEDGNLIIYSEYYEANKRASEVAQSLKEENVKWYIDPASSGSHIEREGRLYTLYDEYYENGIRAESAEKDVDMGINRVGEYFKSGKIKIFSTCKSLIYELERYHWSEEKETATGMMRPKPYKKDDHLADCLRYLVSSRFSKSDMKVSKTSNPESPWSKAEELKKRKEVYVH